MEHDLITARQAADILGVGISTIHRMAEDGRLIEVQKLPGLRGARLFRRSDVLEPDTQDAA